MRKRIEGKLEETLFINAFLKSEIRRNPKHSLVWEIDLLFYLKT